MSENEIVRYKMSENEIVGYKVSIGNIEVVIPELSEESFMKVLDDERLQVFIPALKGKKMRKKLMQRFKDAIKRGDFKSMTKSEVEKC